MVRLAFLLGAKESNVADWRIEQMNITQKEASAHDAFSIRNRINKVFGESRIVGHARFADVIYDVFLSEAREQGWNVAEPAWALLDAAALGNIGNQIKRLVSPHAGGDYVLPAGTVAIAHYVGCVAIGWDTLCVDCDCRGLSDISDMPHRPDGSNLKRLLRYIDKLSREEPFRAIGMPILVDQFNDRHPSHFFQFPPFAPAADVILQRNMDLSRSGVFFCALSDEHIRDFAQDIVNDMRRLWVNADHYVVRTQSWKDAASSFARNVPSVEVRAVTIDVSNEQRCGDRFFIEFDAWDHAFRRGIVVQEVGVRSLDEAFDKDVLDVGSCHESAFDLAVLDRADHVALVRANGADGWIGGLARAIVNAAPEGACAVLADLAQNFETYVNLCGGAREDRFRLFWQDGEICVDNQDWSIMRLSDNVLSLSDRQLPETLLASLLRQPLHVLFDHPFRCDSRISDIKNKYGKIAITVEPDRWLINCQTGEMWARAFGCEKTTDPVTCRILPSRPRMRSD
jgi:hypothetical protein